MRKSPLLAAAAIAVGALAVPAHAEVVEVTLTVSPLFGATASASSTHEGETFQTPTIQRVAVTDAGLDTASGTVVADIQGVTTGSSTYVIAARPDGNTNEAFAFYAVVECVVSPVTGLACTPSAGMHTVITVVTETLGFE